MFRNGVPTWLLLGFSAVCFTVACYAFARAWMTL